MNIFLTLLLKTWELTGQMAPYLILGFLLAGVMSVFINETFVARYLGGKGLGGVLKATLIGVPLPVCSCGVIPLTAFIVKKGAGKGAATAFVASTPQTGVDSFIATYGMMGPVFAVLRVVLAFLTGIVAGLLVDATGPKNEASPAPANGLAEPEHSEPKNIILRILHYGLIELPRDLAKSLIVGLVVAGLLSAVVPPDFFARYLGHDFLAMLVVTAFAVPLYVCSTGSIPVAFALMSAGLSPGAALVFLVTGPATNAATIVTIGKLLGRRVLAIYLGVIVAGAWGAGLLLDLFTIHTNFGRHVHEHAAMTAPWFDHLAAALLLIMLANALWGRKLIAMIKAAPKKSIVGDVLQWRIGGMTCAHCAATVKRAAESCHGVRHVEVSLKNGLATITGSGFHPAALRRAIEDRGYQVK